MKWIIGLVSWITGIFAFTLFIVIHAATQDLTLSRTVAFATLGTTTLLFVFSVRSLTTPVWKTKLFGNHWLTFAVVTGMLLQLAPIYVPALQPIFHTIPLSLSHWAIILVVGVVTVAGIELTKWRFRLNHVREP
jgi:Ca2+-transporting ATPase